MKIRKRNPSEPDEMPEETQKQFAGAHYKEQLDEGKELQEENGGVGYIPGF